MNKLEITDKYAARLLMIGFFLPMKWQATAIIASCVYFCMRVFFGRDKIHVPALLWALVLGGGFLLYVGAMAITAPADRHMLSLLIGRRVSLLLVPLFCAVFMPRFGKVIMGELRFFVFGSIAICIAANLSFIYQVYFVPHPDMLLTHVAYRIFLESFSGLHPTYLSMYLGFAIGIVVCVDISMGKISKIILLYLLLIFLLAILAKSPLIAVFIMLIHYGYRHRQVLLRYKVWMAALFVAVLAGCFFIPFVGQRLAEIFSFFGTRPPAQITDNSVYTRELIWSTDTSLLRQYWLTGVGPARLLRLLDYRYLFYSIRHNFATGYYDPHNEYFWEWLSFGLTGIIVTVFLLFVHFARGIKSGNQLYIYLLLILAITFSTESVLSRQQGILFYAVFTSVFFYAKTSDNRLV